jgi:ribosome-associated protein
MDAIARSKEHAIKIAQLLVEHKAIDTTVLDVGEMSSWTNFFIICTVRSQAHLKGLIEHVNEYFHTNKIKALNSLKNSADQGWVLIDCGTFIIHLMAQEKRDFYELEKLWFNSELLYHSSSSS